MKSNGNPDPARRGRRRVRTLLRPAWALCLPLAVACAPLATTGTKGAAEATADAPAAVSAADGEAPAPAKPRTLSDDDAAEVTFLLRRAEWAIDDDHLTYPARDSALDLYERVQLLDPENETARRGLERIVERYLDLAMSAAERRRFTEAGVMLDRARLVDPGHPGISPTAAQIHLLEDAERHVVALDGDRLRHRDPGLGDALRQAGLASRGDGCRAQITARNDAEGRWIYQQMSQRGQTRIQAQLNIGSPPRVEVMCFPDAP